MCGIFGCMPLDDGWLNRAVEIHHERGPDQNAIFRTNWEGRENIGLAVNRLAISGIGPGNDQPILSRSANAICILNGALFNFRELLEEFDIKNPTDNDASIIVELYEKIGSEFVNYLRGMYAFILIDQSLGKMIVARDPLGIKPLYWSRGEGGRIAFSSSLEAIPDELASNARAFPPGILWMKSPEEEHKVFITPRIRPKLNLEETFQESIKAHIPPDVGWGCSLSGGVDSSLVCAIAKSLGHDFSCYSLFMGQSDDFKASEVAATHLGLNLRPVLVTRDDVLRAIPEMVRAIGSFEEGMIVGGLGSYFVAKAAREDGCKVLLTGMGADEVFGGYQRYLRIPKPSVNDRLIIDQLMLANKQCRQLDHGSMAAGLEARVPFIDNEVIATGRRLPLESKVDISHEWRTKVCLREVATRYLPRATYAREKVAMGRGSGMQGLFKDAIRDFDTGSVSADEVRSFRLKDDVEVSLFSIWKQSFGHFTSSREDIYEKSLGVSGG